MLLGLAESFGGVGVCCSSACRGGEQPLQRWSVRRRVCRSLLMWLGQQGAV